MTFTTEQKSQLAKLMATENLTVQHKKMHTAMFDTKNRVLYLPIWQNMSGDLYDLLCGHEVGHALFTPDQGWHDAAVDKSKGANYKSFLNVIEDARIEKKMKRRYPGLRISFQKGYRELMVKDFFGLKDRNPNKMPFIDRLNLFTKSQYTADWIEFNDIEKQFIVKVESLESWDDVIRLTDEIYEYSKQEQSEMEDYHFQNIMQDMLEGFGDGDGDEMDSEDYETTDEESEEKPKNGKPSQQTDDGDTDNEFDEDNNTVLNRHKESTATDVDQFDPICETDENYRDNESSLIDVKTRDYMYAKIPKPILKNIVTPAKTVHLRMSEHFSQLHTVTPELVSKWVNDFKRKNERYIGLLVKEFEMRKAAKSFSKSKISDTGDLDMNKLSSYQFDDNVFRKVVLTSKGKSHGLILLLDKSGSMSDNLPGSIEQILVISMFCRKVNIPFAVYGFGNSTDARNADLGANAYQSVDACFTKNANELDFDQVFLREYLNSNMSTSEFNQAVRNLILLKKSFERNYGSNRVTHPRSEVLSNTPLTESIVAVAEIMKEFKSKNNLDLTSLVIVHDGDADSISYKRSNDSNSTNHLDANKYNVIIQDIKSKYQNRIDDKLSLNKLILEWFKKSTGSKVFGFYLTPNPRRSRYAIQDQYIHQDGQTYHDLIHSIGYDKTKELMTSLSRKFNEDKFMEMKPIGFNSFYIVAGGQELVTEEDELIVEANATTSKLKTAFMKFNKKKSTNRILVTKFISGIAS
jgi:hypothetical protein